MSYKLESYPDGLPAIVIGFNADFSLKKEMEQFVTEITNHLDAAKRPLYYVNEVDKFPLNFSDLLTALSVSAGKATGLLRHPNIKDILIVDKSGSHLIKIGISAYSQLQYGGLSIRAMDSLKEALDYIKDEESN